MANKKISKKKIEKKKDNGAPELIKEALKKLSKYPIGSDNVPVTNFISADDLWVQTRKGKPGVVIISHEAIERLAKIGQVTITDIKLIISPQASNEQQHVFLISASSPRMPETTQIGEASNRNTHGISRRYLASMAYKRGYDRSVLKALRIEGVYSSTEADEFTEEEVAGQVTNEELAALQKVLAAINKAETKEKLIEGLGQVKKEELSEAQQVYLSKVFANKYAVLTLSK